MESTPVLDAQVLTRLGEELGDRQPLDEFIGRYMRRLDHRVDRLDRALTAQDPEEWMDAILSLKTSSAMAGATALSHTAGQLQQRISPGPPICHWPTDGHRAEIIAGLRRLAEETRHQLSRFLQQPAR